MGAGSSILWVLEIKLRSSGLAASALTLHAILPSRSWVVDTTLLMKIVITIAVLRHYWKMVLFFWEGCSSNSSSAGSRLNYCPSVTRLWLFRPQDSLCSLALLELKLKRSARLRLPLRVLGLRAGASLDPCQHFPTGMNLESVLCPCLKKDCLDLEKWRVLEREPKETIPMWDSRTASSQYSYITSQQTFPSSPC